MGTFEFVVKLSLFRRRKQYRATVACLRCSIPGLKDGRSRGRRNRGRQTGSSAQRSAPPPSYQNLTARCRQAHSFILLFLNLDMVRPSSSHIIPTTKNNAIIFRRELPATATHKCRHRRRTAYTPQFARQTVVRANPLYDSNSYHITLPPVVYNNRYTKPARQDD